MLPSPFSFSKWVILMKIYFSHKKFPLVKNTFSLFLLKKYPLNSSGSEFGFTLAVTLPHHFPLQGVSTVFKNTTISTEDTALCCFTATFLTSKHHYLTFFPEVLCRSRWGHVLGRNVVVPFFEVWEEPEVKVRSQKGWGDGGDCPGEQMWLKAFSSTA